mmetsp:Transcript_17436/g.36264  ORF Transcript_17436/g.36264 Transcript_17436/m.36264 type:complete len:118 (-) Transcript_17436:92-445(-)
MCTADSSPVHSKLGSVLSSGGRNFGNVCDTFSEVELDVFLRINSLDFDEGSVVVLVAEAALVAKDSAVYVEAGWLGVLFGHFCGFIGRDAQASANYEGRATMPSSFIPASTTTKTVA